MGNLNLSFDEAHIGEIGRRLSERIIDHPGRDDKPHLDKHAEKTGHKNVNIDHLKFGRIAIKAANLKENLQRHYILSMKGLL